MTNIIFDDLNKIVTTIKATASYGLLLRKWESLCRELGINEDDIARIRSEVQRTDNHDNIVYNLLASWRASEGSNASLQVLCGAFQNINLHDISENLSTLNQIPTQVNSQNNDFVPIKPRYYIPRSLKPQTRLNTEIFKKPSNDIFLFTGMERYQVSALAGKNRSDISGNQFLEELTVRFILLQEEEHYEEICKIARSPIHWIEYKNEAYYWVKSSGSLELIQSCIFEEQEAISEDDFVKQLIQFDNIPTLLSDSPGMGKSLLLASIAQKLKETCPERVFVYHQLQNLVQQLPDRMEEIIFNKSWDIRRLGKWKFEFFLDGFDEVHPSQQMQVERLFHLLKKLKHIRFHVTTRPHLRTKLENLLGVIAYNILPFQEENIISFLVSYWILEYNASDTNDLKEFAIECLENVQTKLTKQERDFAGVPLQCALLADIHHKQAITFSKGQVVQIQVNSIFDMFKEGIRIKLEKAEMSLNEEDSSAKQTFQHNLIYFHVNEGMKLIFSDWLKTEPKCMRNEVHVGNHHLYRTGIMEKGPSSFPRFVHRTFAEYLIAEYLVKEMATCSECLSLVMGTILKNGSNYQVSISTMDRQVQEMSFRFHYAVICYFIDCQLERFSLPTKNVTARLETNILSNISHCIVACCLNDMCNLFDLLWEPGKLSFHPRKLCNLALVATNVCQKVDTLERLLEKSLAATKAPDIREMCKAMRIKYKASPHMFQVAVHRGSFPIFEYILTQIDNQIEDVECLLHHCCQNSYLNKREVILDKIQIIKRIVQIRKETLEEIDPLYKTTPLLAANSHIDLVKCLINQGADVNSVDDLGSTILHRIYSDSMVHQDMRKAQSFTDFLKMLMTKGFKKFKIKNQPDTILLRNLVHYMEMEEEAMQILYENGIDFNSFDERGNSVLYYALTSRVSVSFIERLLKYGCDPSCTKRRSNALHLAVTEGNAEVVEYLVENRICKLNGFDEKWRTALYLNSKRRLDRDFKEYERIRTILIEHGAEFRKCCVL